MIILVLRPDPRLHMGSDGIGPRPLGAQSIGVGPVVCCCRWYVWREIPRARVCVSGAGSHVCDRLRPRKPSGPVEEPARGGGV